MSFLKSFFYAFRGIVGCVCEQRNLRIHTVFSLYVLYFSQFYKLSIESMCVLWLLIALVLALELMNTAVEKACDAITLEKSEMIKIAKDAAAGAVLEIMRFLSAAEEPAPIVIVWPEVPKFAAVVP